MNLIKIFLCLGLYGILSTTAQAGLPSGACRDTNADKFNCQFEVRSYTLAPDLSQTLGIKMNSGVNYVLFNNYKIDTHPTIGPRFVSNTGSHDIFIPQRLSEEFLSFLNVPIPNIKKEYAVQPASYTVTPLKCPTLVATPTSVPLDVPPADSTNPVVVKKYSLVLNPSTPATTKKVIYSNTAGAPVLQFKYTRQDCSNDAQNSGPYCTNVAYLEEQSLTFAAQGTVPNFKWGTPAINAVLYVSLNGGAYAPAADCTTTYAPAINASCGSSNGLSVASKPSTNLCTKGNPSVVAGAGPWTWTCTGVNGGTNASCSANTLPPSNGACGSSNGASLTTAPTTGLCSQGTQSAVTGTGPWSWSCAGSNGGTTASCSAAYLAPVNGVCGPSNGVGMSGAPTTGLCSAGTQSAVSGVGPWSWSCAGANGGATASCSASYVPPCVPTSCRDCNASGQLVNKANNVECQVGGGTWNARNATAGWCNNGRCMAHFTDTCSGTAGQAMCWKVKNSSVTRNTTNGTYIKYSCSSCGAGDNVDNCSVCRNEWGSGRAGDWYNFDRYFD